MIELLLFMLSLTHCQPRDRMEQYAQAIITATNDRTERRVLAVVGLHENDFAARSPTPPFGVTYYQHTHPGERIIVARGAVIALATLRAIRTTACPGAPWQVVLGRYNMGPNHPQHGCYSNALSRLEAAEVQPETGHERHHAR